MKTRFKLTGLLLTLNIVILISASLKAQTIQIAFTLKTYNGGYNVSCYGASDGNIDITVVGGTWPYTYLWSNGAVTKNLHGVVAATYTVTVTDLNNNTAQGNVSLTQTKPFDVYLQPSEYSGGYNISETGANNGYIYSHVSGGTPPYTYLWSNGSVQESISELVAGTYTATVTDMNQCQVTQSVTLIEPTPLHIVSLTSPVHHGYNISCSGGSDGIINLTVAGGTPPYTYEWSNGNFIEDLSDVPRGVYSVRITDANWATVDDQIILTAPNSLTVHLTRYTYGNGYNTSCHICTDGSITTTVTGGATPYSYLWNGGQTSANIANIGAGDYMLTVTDANGCQRNSETVLTRPDQPQSEDWTIGGNTGTNPGSNYIGTNDQKDVVFKTNGSERMRLSSVGDLKISNLSSSAYKVVFADQSGNLKVDLSPSVLLANPVPWMSRGNDLINSTYDFIGTVNNADFVFKSNAQERMRIKNYGKISISEFVNQSFGLLYTDNLGDINKLDFDYTVANKVLFSNGTWGNITGGAGLWNSTGNNINNTNSGNVGIGSTTTPSQKFEVTHNDVVGVAGGMSLKNLSTANKNSEIKFYQNNTPLWAIGNSITHDNSQNFFIYDNAGNALRFLIDGSGNTGMGTSSPSEKLQVTDGNLYIQGENRGLIVDAQTSKRVGFLKYSGRETGIWRTSNQKFEIGRVNVSSLPGTPTSFTTDLLIDGNGKTFIGFNTLPCVSCTTALYKLYVDGGIAAKDVKVTAQNFPDYVFEKDYGLMSIYELDNYIKQNKHLPDVKTADEIKNDNGFSLGEMQTVLLKKIEEQTLYIIALQKQVDELKAKIK